MHFQRRGQGERLCVALGQSGRGTGDLSGKRRSIKYHIRHSLVLGQTWKDDTMQALGLC